MLFISLQTKEWFQHTMTVSLQRKLKNIPKVSPFIPQAKYPPQHYLGSDHSLTAAMLDSVVNAQLKCFSGTTYGASHC